MPASFSFLNPSIGRSIALGSPLALSLLAMGSGVPSAQAAEQLVVTYGALQVSFEVSELEQLAQTGEVPSSLQFYLEIANLTAEDLRSILATEVSVSHRFLDQMLNSEGGEYVLSEMTQVVHTPSRQENIAALRSALVMSASDDQQVSVLELLQNYPTQQVYLNSGNLIELANDLQSPSITDEATVE